MKFKGILLDIDNTLYPYQFPHQAGMQAAFDYLKAQGVEDAALSPQFHAARKFINSSLAETAASHNRMLYFQRMCEGIGINSLEHSLPLYAAYWDTFLANMCPDDGVLDFFNTMELPICIVTDLTAVIQHRKIEQLGIASSIRFIVTSEEAGQEKPAAGIFNLALEKLGLSASECCMIGDNFEKDIVGAAALGIQPFWLNRDNEQKALLPNMTEFKSFKQIKEFLDVQAR